MSFIADKQTLEDLNLLGKFRQQSVYSIFNKVKTAGGERLLEQMFQQPMSDAGAINDRSDLFRYFQEKQCVFSLREELVTLAETYLLAGAPASRIVNTAGMLQKQIMQLLLRDEQYQRLQDGLVATIEMLNTLNDLLKGLDIALVQPARQILASNKLAWLQQERGVTKLSLLKAAEYDRLLRGAYRKEMETVMETIHALDVYIAVSDVARASGFIYAQALPAGQDLCRATNLRHPALENAVDNPLTLDGEHNVLFLTGANMAGKSTFMKSFGIAVYLAHMGFPVAAGKMEFSVKDGLYSSINVPDSLTMGYSHFYAEVLRVKKVAAEVASGKNMVVIFDELFKGTNVKDAYDATLSCTASFARFRNCFFIISTHIIEVGEALRGEHTNLRFAYMPTIMDGPVPRYTYRLTEGITSDRHGMIIIENEKILESLLAPTC